MNIVLISSCQDSSNLAKELNKKMKNSVVFRIDLLKNLKNIIPFSSISSNSCGDYLGDIEKIEFNKISDAERQIAKVFQSTVKTMEDSPTLSHIMSNNKVLLPSIDRVTRNFDSLSLTLIRVVSGIQSVNQLKHYLGNNSSSVVIHIDKPNLPLFDFEITKKDFLEIKDSKVYENHLFFSIEDLTSLLQDEVFNLLLNPVDKKQKEVKQQAEECCKEEVSAVEAVPTTVIGDVERAVIQNAGPGLLAQLRTGRIEAGPFPNVLTTAALNTFINTTTAVAA